MGDVGEPRWLRILALGAALTVAVFGAAGLLLADLGLYRPWLVLLLGLAGCSGLFVCLRPLLRVEAEVTGTDHVCGLLAVGFSVLVSGWNGAHASQHVQINRDGGLYLNTGKWIATHGTLNIEPFVGPFARNANLIATSTGMKQRGSHLEFDLSHMLSAILAEAQNLGGTRLVFLASPILGGFALLAFYRLAARLLRQPVAALGAMATLALLMPQVAFSRDSTTEIPIQLLFFTSVWLLCDRRTLRTAGPAFATGLLLGLVQAMHLDGIAFLVGLPAVFAITWLHTNRAGRPRVLRGILWSIVGIVAGLLVATLDLLRWDRYYLGLLHQNVEKLAIVVILAIVVAIGAVMIVRRANVFHAVQRWRPRFANVAGAIVVVAGFGLWFVRPHVQHVRAADNPFVAYVQTLNHVPVDGTRRYAELSVRWISWYVGPITLTLAILGAAALTVALVRGSLRLPVRVATFMFAPPALLYIWRPCIAPDQVWAARRFLPAVFPALILLAFAVICAVANAPNPKVKSLRRGAAIALAAATVMYPLLTLRKVSQMAEQRGLFPVITQACKIIGPTAAVVVLPEPRSVAYLSDPQTLRSFCNVPVMVLKPGVSPRVLHALAAQWEADGRRLFAVAEYPTTISASMPSAAVRTTARRINPHLLELTITRRPSGYFTEMFQLSAAPVRAIPAGTH